MAPNPPPPGRDARAAHEGRKKKETCRNFSPPWFTGRWRDWHRGHGCNLDDGKPRSAAAVAEIYGEEAPHGD
jgi:hypothetical protein